MRLVPTGRGSEVKAVFDVAACSSCGLSFRRLGAYRPTPHRCHHHDAYHYTLTCRRCGTVTWDERCDEMRPVHPLEGHRTGPGWLDAPHGPTADYGDD